MYLPRWIRLLWKRRWGHSRSAGPRRALDSPADLPPSPPAGSAASPRLRPAVGPKEWPAGFPPAMPARPTLSAMRAGAPFVEFVGGPLDGYRENLAVPASDLAAMIVVPVSLQRLMVLYNSTGERDKPTADSPTTLAFYELHQAWEQAARYVFRGVRLAENASGLGQH
ncbi:MAG: hypothetical protein KDA80_02300 [Planctomycetaceae bacterium]|nr:hypothetical protein [Planctomycetaceae bacterium]